METLFIIICDLGFIISDIVLIIKERFEMNFQNFLKIL